MTPTRSVHPPVSSESASQTVGVTIGGGGADSRGRHLVPLGAVPRLFVAGAGRSPAAKLVLLHRVTEARGRAADASVLSLIGTLLVFACFAAAVVLL